MIQEPYTSLTSVWLRPKSVADMLGLPIETLTNWRMTDVGPPYIKFSDSAQAHVRYSHEQVHEWQKRCQRVVPKGWQPVEVIAGDSVPSTTSVIEWMPPKRAAIALDIPIPTMTAWRKRAIGLPFVWIGGGGAHEVMYERRDIEAFIARRQADPSVVPIIEKKVYGKDPRTPEERARMNAEIWKGMGHSDDEIRRMLGPRFARLILPRPTPIRIR